MTELAVHRTLPYPAEKVWRAWTDPLALAAWFWPEAFVTTAETDLRVGGRYRIDGPGGGLAVAGEYLVVEKPRRLVFTWRWDGEDAVTLVTVELAPSKGGTDLAVVHAQLSDDATRDRHAQGWDACLARLPGWLSAPYEA